MTRVMLLFVVVALALGPVKTAGAAPRSAVADAYSLFSQMTPEERIGQLFMVAFVGDNVAPGSEIATLLQEDKIGGVVLLAANGNFRNRSDTPRQVAALTENLQGLVTGPQGISGIPLLIAIDHEGDGYPYSRITGGVTPLASPLAIGATWDPALAEATGYVAGLELAAMGINMVLGPSVDVLQHPRAGLKGDLGIRTFGGDPYWVGRMGRAYIRGIHEGSNARVVTVAKHFPGHGGSDRLPDEEVATVDKSLQELRRVELAPFFAVTAGRPGSSPDITDALMTSHIRYRGFQGENIRQLTAPISFDSAGLRAILGLPEFDAWREGGLMVSDALGVPAVRKYYDPTLTRFPHRQIAREALYAGNDLLILAQYALTNHWPDQYANIRDTIVFFREQYAADSVFRARVDEAALKVLRLKLRIYPDLAKGRGRVVLPLTNPPVAGRRWEVTETVARGALTLLYPRTAADLASRLPSAPRRSEQIVIFTDSRQVQDCYVPDCVPFSSLPVTAMEEAILRIYGPEATNEVDPGQITSFSFSELKAFLAGSVDIGGGVLPGELASEAWAAPPTATPEPIAEVVGAALQQADWIVLVMQDIVPVANDPRPGMADSDAARIFLDTVADSLFDRKIVAFALNVPYQLDTTEVTKLTAYFGLYSKQQPFIDVAARALFKDAEPPGAPAISVEPINYDLTLQLQPNPALPLPLSLTKQEIQAPGEVEVAVGPVLDHNGHIVPDGTIVEVWGSWLAGGSETPRVQAQTRNGRAVALLPVAQGGQLAVHASSFGATSGEPALVTAIGPRPSPEPTATPEPIPTNPPLDEPVVEPTEAPAEPTATPGKVIARVYASPTPTELLQRPVVADQPTSSTFAELATTLSVLALIGGAVMTWSQRMTVVAVRRGTLVVIGGLIAYIGYGLGWWGVMGEPLMPLTMGVVGGGVGLLVSLLWPGEAGRES